MKFMVTRLDRDGSLNVLEVEADFHNIDHGTLEFFNRDGTRDWDTKLVVAFAPGMWHICEDAAKSNVQEILDVMQPVEHAELQPERALDPVN